MNSSIYTHCSVAVRSVLSLSSSMTNVDIRNITGVGTFGCELNLQQIFAWLSHAVEKKKCKVCTQTIESSTNDRRKIKRKQLAEKTDMTLKSSAAVDECKKQQLPAEKKHQCIAFQRIDSSHSTPSESACDAIPHWSSCVCVC